MNDLETLKAYCHWKRKEKDVDEDTLDFVKSIENVISQVNNWKAKYEKVIADKFLKENSELMDDLTQQEELTKRNETS